MERQCETEMIENKRVKTPKYDWEETGKDKIKKRQEDYTGLRDIQMQILHGSQIKLKFTATA